MKIGFDYISYRKKTRSGRYKLLRRTDKMIEMIRLFKREEPLAILDVGAADGFMLNSFNACLSTKICLGIEPSWEFISSKAGSGCQIIQAVGEKMPFKNSIFDIITAASVLDHMLQPNLFLRECRRVLKKGGIVIVSLVSPLFDRLAVKLKVKEDDHGFHFSDRQLSDMLKQEEFDVLKASRFALPFFGIPGEKVLERTFNRVGLKWPMFYILTVGRAKG